MKSTKKILTSGLLLIVISLISSCTQDNVGDRYKVVFWFNESNSRLMLDDGANSLTFYINEKAVATSVVDDVFWATAPACESANAITAHVDLLPREKTIRFKVIDQSGFEYASGTTNLVTNYCNTIEIIPSDTKYK